MSENIVAGNIEISNDVIGTIAGIALSEVPGIAGMKGSFFKDIKRAATGRKDFSAGVDVTPEKEIDSFALDLHIIIEYNVKVNDVAVKAQKVVKEKVEEITGKTVSAVNIHVVEIKLPESLLGTDRES